MTSTTEALTPAIAARRRTILLFQYSAGVFLFWMSLYLYIPTLPIYAQSKTADLAMVGVALSMYGLWQAVIRLPLGITADWVGRRKPFILAGFILSALGAYWMGTANGINGVILGRAVTGFAAATWVPMVVAYSSLFPPLEAARAASSLTLVNSISRMVASLLTGPLTNLGGVTLPFFGSIATAGLGFLVVLPARETRQPSVRPSLDTTGRLVIRKDVLMPAVLNAILQYATWASTFGFTPILAKQFGASSVQQSLLVTLNIGSVVIGNLVAASLVKRTGERNLVYTAFIMMSAGIALAAMAPSLAWVYVVQCLTGLAGGVGYPILMGMSIAHVTEKERNTAMGLHQAVYAIGMFAGPWISGILAEKIGIQPMFAVTATVCLGLGLLGTWYTSRRN